MRRYEYKVVPVPERYSVKGAEKGVDPAAFAVEAMLNDLGLLCWEYLRTDRMTLQKGGILGRSEVEREFLIFRRHPVALAQRQPAEDVKAPVALLSDRPALTIEEIRARRVKNPDLLEGAKAGRRRIMPRPVITEAAADEPVIAAEYTTTPASCEAGDPSAVGAGREARAEPGGGSSGRARLFSPTQALICSWSAWMRPTMSGPSASWTARWRSMRDMSAKAGAAISTRQWLSPPSW
jgi:hypothetical protein